eukprot:257734-Hanusia_phi.AAC.1
MKGNELEAGAGAGAKATERRGMIEKEERRGGGMEDGGEMEEEEGEMEEKDRERGSSYLSTESLSGCQRGEGNVDWLLLALFLLLGFFLSSRHRLLVSCHDLFKVADGL